MTDKIKILTFTPVHERYEVLLICLKGLTRLVNYKPETFDIRPFFIVSNNQEKDIIEQFGFDYMEYKNEPLGEKKNAGLKYAIEHFEFDYLMEIGSDDLIIDEYLDLIEPELRAKTPLFNLSTCYFIDTVSGKASKWTSDIVIGLGRFISRDAIMSSFAVKFMFFQNMAGPDMSVQAKKLYDLPQKSAENYQIHGYGEVISTGEAYLWNNNGVRGMDTFSMNTLARSGINNKVIENDGIYLVDIKSRNGLNKFDLFTPIKSSAAILKKIPEAKDIIRLIEANSIKPIKKKRCKLVK